MITDSKPNQRTKYKATKHTLQGDRITPVEAYYRLRDFAPDAVLLESSDYHSREHSLSFLCIDPVAEIEIKDSTVTYVNRNLVHRQPLAPTESIAGVLQQWLNHFEIESDAETYKHIGVFGFTTNSVIENTLSVEMSRKSALPVCNYRFYRFILIFDHFNYTLRCIENTGEGQSSRLSDLLARLRIPGAHEFPVQISPERESNMTDAEFLDMVARGKQHCHRGDVFQIVLSRAYSRTFTGDPFTLYRSLRSVNPSPYLFYFDYGAYKLFGSSPESQLIIQDGTAEIHPIAGTYKRTGDDDADMAASRAIVNDTKETAEHMMLVDLARNDLSTFADNVQVERLKEIQFFSHVIHMTSKVTGTLKPESTAFKALFNSFPAGTLSGAPKKRALELITEYEAGPRNLYGGAVGMMGLDGSVNHAIIIRSFLTIGNELHYQAGAGIVMDSNPQSELDEVENKVGALEKAIELSRKSLKL